MKLLLTILFLFGVTATLTDVKAETNTVSSTVVTNSTPPTANAPTIMNNSSDICKIGVGGAVQNNVLGVATGILVDDELCQQLKLSRSLYGYGMKNCDNQYARGDVRNTYMLNDFKRTHTLGHFKHPC